MRAFRLAASLVAGGLAAVCMGNAGVLAQPLTNPAAGEYHTVSHEAGFNFFDPSTGNFASVDVTDTVSTAAPFGTQPQTTDVTQLNLEIFSGGIGQQACYQIPAADFTFSSGSAALHTMITSDTTSCTPPFEVPPPPPFSIDVTWTGNGPVTSNQGLTTFSCGSYGLETTTMLTLQGASATASISPLLPTPLTASQFQLLRSEDDLQHAVGVLPNNCQSFGAIAGGAGPPPAGNYQTSTGETSFNTTTDAGVFVEVNVFQNVQVSSPLGGPSTTTSQFQLGIDAFGNGTFARGCFDVTPANFTSNGVQGATLSMTVDSTTPTCFPGGQTSLPLPLTVNIVWTGSGPVATTRNTGTFNCLTYRSESTGVTETNNANVSATLTPLLPNAISATGSLGTATSILQAEGAQQPDCHL